MNTTAHVHLALNGRDAPLAGKGAGRNPRRPAKAVVSYRHDGEAIDLANSLSLAVQHERALLDERSSPLFDHIGTVGLLLDGLVHVLGRDDRVSVVAGPEACLAHQICHQAKARGEFFLVGGQARAVFHHLRHGGRIKRQQPFLFAPGADKERVLALAFRRPVHVHVKVCFYLEPLAKVLVGVVQPIIQGRTAHQDDFDL